MPRNGSGTYTAPSNSFNPAVSSTTISSSDWNSTLDDLETALTNSLAKDGQTTPTANLPMGGFKHTGVADTAARTEYAKASQVQDGSFTYLTSPSGTDTITATGPISLAAYAAGQSFRFKAAGTNTGATTININSLGAKAIQKNLAALVAGDITANDIVEIVYDGTQFQMVSPARTHVFTAGSIPFSALDPDFLDDATEVVITATDNILLGDVSDSGNTKRDTVQGVLDLVAPDLAGKADTVILAGDKITFYDVSDSNNPKTDTVQGILDLVPAVFTSGVVANASGTSVTFSSIPSGVKGITIILSALSTNGTEDIEVALGDSGGIETSGYAGSISRIGAAAVSSAVGPTDAFTIINDMAASNVCHGIIDLSLIDSSTNTWVIKSGCGKSDSAGSFISTGSKSLSATLDRVQVQTAGTNTFDAGKINIQYHT